MREQVTQADILRFVRETFNLGNEFLDAMAMAGFLLNCQAIFAYVLQGNGEDAIRLLSELTDDQREAVALGADILAKVARA